MDGGGVVFCGSGADETFDECTDAADAADRSTRLVVTTNPVHHAAVSAAKATKNRFDPDFIASLLGAPFRRSYAWSGVR